MSTTAHRTAGPARPPRRPWTRSQRDEDLSVGAYLDGWLEGRQSLRPSTELAYRIHLDRYLIPHLGHLLLPDLKIEDIEGMYRSIQALDPTSKVAPATVRRIHATLMSALNAAVRRRLIPHNPAQFVELPRAPHTRMTVWTPPQLASFLEHTRGDRLHALFLLMALTGLRRGEAIGLRWTDVDLDRGVLRVEQQIVAVAAHRHTGPPKSAHGLRSVSLPPQLVEALRRHAAQQHGERAAAGSAWVDTGLVFTTPHGEALNPGQVSRRFERLLRGAGLPPIRLHDLRHTSACLGLESGETLLEVSRRLGHSSITITADVYSRIAPTTARQSAQRLQDLIIRTRPSAGAPLHH